MVFFSLLFVVYGSFMLYILLGLKRLRSKNVNHQKYPEVSIVIPVHNEDTSLLKTLKALKAQNYAGKWEVIWVNDRSTDQSQAILQEFCHDLDHFKVLSISKTEGAVPYAKKRAMDLGFTAAQYDILMSTDADCLPPVNWISSMLANFSTDVDIVQGPKEVINEGNLVTSIQQIDTLGFVLMEAAFYSHQNPLLSSAPSLAYRKSIYEKAGGMKALFHQSGGDDDVLVQNMMPFMNKVAYNFDPESAVRTQGVQSFKALFVQRARWAASGSSYASPIYIAFLLSIYLCFLSLLLTPFLALFSLISVKIPILIWSVKLLFDLLMMGYGCIKFRRLKFLLYFFPAQLVQVLLVVWAAPAGHFKWYSWK